MNVPGHSSADAARAASPVSAAARDVPPEHAPRRPERNPDYRGWCSLCGTAIYPSATNWYCRSCAAAVSAKGFH